MVEGIVFVGLVGFMIYVIIYGKKVENQKKTAFEDLRSIYLSKKNEFNVPNGAKKVTYKWKSKNSEFCLKRGEYLVWTNDSKLCLFPEEPSSLNHLEQTEAWDKTEIPLEKIEYFYYRGEVRNELVISGGGGGGSSIKGAIVGGALAGGAGAIIGSRKKTDPITSKTVKVDERETYINYFDDDGIRRSLFFAYNDFFILRDILPEKEYNAKLSDKKSNPNVVIKKDAKDIAIELREYGKLRDEGLITEEDYHKKKAELLKV